MTPTTDKAQESPRMVWSEDLVGMREIADKAEVQGMTVARWAQRHPDFPLPVRVLAAGRLWIWNEVEAWLEKTGRM